MSPLTERTDELDLWSCAREIFEQVLALPPDERQCTVEVLCGADPALAKAVRSLLTWDVATSRPPSATCAATAPEPDRTGSFVGGYRLVKKLGRGGAGIVYLALCPGEASPPRWAALKLLSQTAGESDESSLQEEGRILSRLDHPGIARLFEAGRSAKGQPFLALEWVDGEPLTASCDARRLPLSARLGLFREVCRAVGHAHQRRVVHLDLKPPNILVDRSGRPRLLDFGIAQCLDAETGSRRVAWLSPGYASPEQVLGGTLSPASDIYSLGVLLYELMVGIRPQPTDPLDLLAFFASGAPAPGTAILRAEAGFGSMVAAARRLPDARTLARILAGRLDALVMRCLEREPENRYSSVGHLVRDLAAGRFFNA